MINLSQNGMRCRATKAIRAHQGVRCSTKGTIQGVVDSLGRQLINVSHLDRHSVVALPWSMNNAG